MENKWKKYKKNIRIFLDENCESKRVNIRKREMRRNGERRKIVKSH